MRCTFLISFIKDTARNKEKEDDPLWQSISILFYETRDVFSPYLCEWQFHMTSCIGRAFSHWNGNSCNTYSIKIYRNANNK